MTIKIYPKEIDDGIGELVKSTASVSYCSEAKINTAAIETAKDVISDPSILEKIMAENKDQIDLHYLESVLVSCGWNKNDDVFLAQSTWDARGTPEDKQFNFMHDENDIIGHITGSYVLTKDGKAVADGADMPEDFDIITQAVLYNSWTDEENRERMQKIISEIREGKWFVSMECLFSGFDYALQGPDGEAKLLARSEDSAFLTKHLRAYGGTGEYEGYKIGRALSNIAFSGKGLVSRPANPRSVILNSKSTAQFNVQEMNSNLSIVGDFNMSDTTLLEKQLAEVQADLADAKAENEAIKVKIEDAKDKEFASTIEAFETEAGQSNAKIDELNELIKSTQARVAELEDQLATSQTDLADAIQTVEAMEQKEKTEKRKAALIEAGISEADVEASLTSFDALGDEAFESVVALMKKKAAWPPEKDEDKKDKKDKKGKKDEEVKSEETEAEEVTEEVFADLESSEATLVESEEVDEIEQTRASIADWFETHVLNTK